MNIDMQRFHATFFAESREGLDAMEDGLLALEAGRQDAETIHSVFRAAHSIKGGAGTFGFQTMADVTHVLETLLDELRAGQRVLTAAATEAMLGAVDVLRALLAEAEHGQQADPQQVQAIIARLRAVLDHAAAPGSGAASPLASAAASNGWEVGFRPAPGLFLSGNDPLRILRELAELGPLQVKADLDQLPPFDQLDPLNAHIGWDIQLQASCTEAAVREVFSWVEDECALRIAPLAATPPPGPASTAVVDAVDAPASPRASTAEAPPASAAAPAAGHGHSEAESSIRVSTDKVDALINLVGELVITQAMIKQVSSSIDPVHAEKLLAGLDLLERNTRDLQEAVISVRMLPVDAVFRRFPRLVRDLSSRLGKQVTLRTLGEGTELDKGLIEKIADPLVHLVRNSIDHGLELPEQRQAAGKPAAGTLTLAASHQGGHIVIEVADDGRGLDREKILAKARERGLAVPDSPSDSQVWDLIFQPGFSTADAVTELSGRGVGMDVVRRNIQSLGGEVQIESHLGRGTRTLIRLPLTLAILDGMTVTASDQTLILPLAYVIEALQPQDADINTVAGDGRVLRVRGEYLPLLSLQAIYGFQPPDNAAGKPLVVVVEADGQKLALEVDELVGQQQVVVKNIEHNYRRIDGVSGATILGDGRVALIVDIGGLVRRQRLPQAA